MDCETLERRTLLAASLVDGVLSVGGTERADTVVVAEAGSAAAGVIRVHVNGARRTFAARDVVRIIVVARGGSDRVDLTGTSRPGLIKGNDGQDTLIGGSGRIESSAGPGTTGSTAAPATIAWTAARAAIGSPAARATTPPTTPAARAQSPSPSAPARTTAKRGSMTTSAPTSKGSWAAPAPTGSKARTRPMPCMAARGMTCARLLDLESRLPQGPCPRH